MYTASNCGCGAVGCTGGVVKGKFGVVGEGLWLSGGAECGNCDHVSAREEVLVWPCLKMEVREW